MKLAAITGASAGVGRAVSRLFAQKGYDLALIARGLKGLEMAKKEAEHLGRRASIYQVDVANYKQVFQAVDMIESRMGEIDVWVNNAMVSVFSPVSSLTPDEIKRVTEVTYLGFVYCTMACLEKMKKRNSGHIVQVGSALAFRGIPLQSAYCAAKHAIKGFTESLRSELLHDKSSIIVNMVHLPAVNTPQFDWSKSKLKKQPKPVAPIFQPELAAEAIYYAATHNIRQIMLGGNTKLVVAGNKILPILGDYYLAYRGYQSQMTDQNISPDRKDNLWQPVDEDVDAGAHGRFDQEAKDHSYFWDIRKIFHKL